LKIELAAGAARQTRIFSWDLPTFFFFSLYCALKFYQLSPSQFLRISVVLSCSDDETRPATDNFQDAFAILFAAHHPKINLLGISTVHGNASLSRTTYNASSLLTAMGRTEIPVYAGASIGLARPAVHAPDIHGESGLDGTSLLPIPKIPHREEPAVDAMAVALLNCEKGTPWLVATGALTNIAQLFDRYPDVVSIRCEESLPPLTSHLIILEKFTNAQSRRATLKV
jgi:hypothetical protein